MEHAGWRPIGLETFAHGIVQYAHRRMRDVHGTASESDFSQAGAVPPGRPGSSPAHAQRAVRGVERLDQTASISFHGAPPDALHIRVVSVPKHSCDVGSLCSPNPCRIRDRGGTLTAPLRKIPRPSKCSIVAQLRALWYQNTMGALCAGQRHHIVGGHGVSPRSERRFGVVVSSERNTARSVRKPNWRDPRECAECRIDRIGRKGNSISPRERPGSITSAAERRTRSRLR